MKKLLFAIITIALILLVIYLVLNQQEDAEISYGTEHFIKKNLTNDNGTLATYMRETKEDEDSVKGREALAETLGLWMLYAIKKDDQKLFDSSFENLKEYFLRSDGFVYWKLSENGKKEVYSNALIDDVRIIYALFQASDKWENKDYKKTAVKISEFTTENNMNKDILTDYYDEKYNLPSNSVTLSYIDPVAIDLMATNNVLPEKTNEKMRDVLLEMPLQSSFFPKKYNVERNKYHFDEHIKMVDQSIVALNLARMGASTNEFHQFIAKEFEKEEVIYDVYDLKTQKSLVADESPAVYGFLVMYLLERGDDDLAKKIYDRMNYFKTKKNKYSGGYSVYKKNTHIYDNLIPLLAEEEMKDRDLIVN